MRIFHLVRMEDVSGVSGTGHIAEGVEFHDGQICLSWFGRYHAVGIYPDIKTLMKIHGHEGRTTVQWQPVGKGIPISAGPSPAGG